MKFLDYAILFCAGAFVIENLVFLQLYIFLIK
jgi:hypothetical protein